MFSPPSMPARRTIYFVSVFLYFLKFLLMVDLGANRSWELQNGSSPKNDGSCGFAEQFANRYTCTQIVLVYANKAYSNISIWDLVDHSELWLSDYDYLRPRNIAYLAYSIFLEIFLLTNLLTNRHSVECCSPRYHQPGSRMF